MSCGNYSDELRKSAAGWQLVAILPCIDPKQGNYGGYNMSHIRRQHILFHDCIELVCRNLVDNFKKGETILCADGYVRTIKPLVAAWLGDREEHQVLTNAIQVCCPLSGLNKVFYTYVQQFFMFYCLTNLSVTV